MTKPTFLHRIKNAVAKLFKENANDDDVGSTQQQVTQTSAPTTDDTISAEAKGEVNENKPSAHSDAGSDVDTDPETETQMGEPSSDLDVPEEEAETSDERSSLEPAQDLEAPVAEVVEATEATTAERLYLDEEEQEIQRIEGQLAEYRQTLMTLLDGGERTLRLKAEMINLKEQKLNKKEVDLTAKERELDERLSQIDADLKNTNKLKTDIEMKIDTLKKLEGKWKVWKQEEKALLENVVTVPEAAAQSGVDDDVKKLLRVLDDLLEHLPDEIVENFSKTEDYDLYLKVFEKHKVR